jgi:uncharacterized MAPEG superfamily protein
LLAWTEFNTKNTLLAEPQNRAASRIGIIAVGKGYRQPVNTDVFRAAALEIRHTAALITGGWRMSIALYCVLTAGLMPFVWTGIAKLRGPRYDNGNVRQWQGRLEGLALRAHAAHLNSFEAFPLFAVAVVVAQMHAVDPSYVDTLSLAFIGLRVLYGILYLANQAVLRSLIWMAAIVCNVMIFVSASGAH